MGPLLHLPTLLLVTVTTSTVMAASLLLVRADRRREGLGTWAVALLLHALACALLAGRGKLPDMLSVMLANALMSGVFSCLLGAIHQFQGRPLPWGWMLAPVAFTGILFTVFLHVLQMRLMLASGILSIQLVLALRALALVDRRDAGRGVWFVFGGLLLLLLLLLARGVEAALGVGPSDAVSQGDLGEHFVVFLVTFIVVQSSSFGFVLMAMDRATEINRRLAAQDPLTGVPNRRATIAALEQRVAQSSRSGEPIAVMMVDIDHFKHINDRFGHLAGDQVLRGVVATLNSRLRKQDLVGRYGGEEFLLLLPSTPLAGATTLARQLCVAVEQARLESAGHRVPVTLSIGVAAGVPQPGDNWEHLVAAADAEMYRAKHGGRNQVAACAFPAVRAA